MAARPASSSISRYGEARITAIKDSPDFGLCVRRPGIAAFAGGGFVLLVMQGSIAWTVGGFDVRRCDGASQALP
jgi:hypothetical protein